MFYKRKKIIHIHLKNIKNIKEIKEIEEIEEIKEIEEIEDELNLRRKFEKNMQKLFSVNII